jgi:hypothetical protein
MAGVEILAGCVIDNGMPVERLLCHPRLPLVAAFDGQRPAAHVFDCGQGDLRPLATVGDGAAPYGKVERWERMLREPFVAWHPVDPLLLAAVEGTLWCWAPPGVAEVTGLPPDAAYEELMFSPDGRTLWATPSTADRWKADAIDLATGTHTVIDWYPWCTAHPAGGVVSTLMLNQGASHALFARVDDATPADLHLQREAVILDCDGYLPAVFSPDGRYFAIRGNAYADTLSVYAFPSLEQVLVERFEDGDWSRNDITFGARPGMLWVGTPTGALRSYDLTRDGARTDHGTPADAPVSAMATTSLGHLVMGSDNGEILLLSPPHGAAADHPVDPAAMRAGVAAYLAATEDIPADATDIESHLTITDGDRTWSPEDLDTVKDATTDDPSWLQLRAMYNRLFENGPPDSLR